MRRSINLSLGNGNLEELKSLQNASSPRRLANVKSLWSSRSDADYFEKSLDYKYCTCITNVTSSAKEIFERTTKDNDKLSPDTLLLLKQCEHLTSEQYNSLEHRSLNRQISKAVRRDIRRKNTQIIHRLIEKHRGPKVFQRATSSGTSQLNKLEDENGHIVTDTSGLLNVLAKFYDKLYESQNIQYLTDSAECSRTTLTKHYTGDIPDISTYEVKQALKQLNVTSRISQRLDEYQPKEQAGFRSGFSTVDYILTVRQVIQKSLEYNLPLYLALVDYEKAFNTVEHWAIFDSLKRCRIDYRYIQLLKNLYRSASTTVQIQGSKTSRPLGRRVRQGDVISPFHKCTRRRI
ncbi:uncharacterized protein LOC133516660 [Cydia pomonella]|uniref:uncharacterized protein LOC133516660 n=1 Tax=Cydia pomonella TaxID=82600 RepID=UPI002ADDD233|nr:uncharacterized protein LOC133516660 [Cydia pomonella]